MGHIEQAGGAFSEAAVKLLPALEFVLASLQHPYYADPLSRIVRVPAQKELET